MFKVSFWSMMTAAMVVGVCYNLYSISDKFFSYPVAVSISDLVQELIWFVKLMIVLVKTRDCK